MSQESSRPSVAFTFILVLATGTLFLHGPDLLTHTLPSSTTESKLPPAKSPPVTSLPEACRAYIENNTLSLKHGRYIHIPGRPAPYDHNSCFLMKPRYNCATNDSLAPKAHEWKFILQSDMNDNSTICDIQAVVDSLGGPAAATKHRRVALFGNSLLRQAFEAMACKYQDQLTFALVTDRAPNISLAATKERGNKLLDSSDFGGMIEMPLNQRPIPRCSGQAADFHKSFHAGVNLTTPHLVDQCSDDLGMMEYNSNLKVYYNFHPEKLNNTLQFYKEMIDLNVNNLDYVAYNANSKQHFDTLHAGNNSVWVDFDVHHVLFRLRAIQKRDAGMWFGANNPWITRPPDNHPCLPGVPDDEVALLLFSLIYDIYEFV